MRSLSLNEAMSVAKQIRQSSVVDKEYWPWVIDELCRMLHEERAFSQMVSDDPKRNGNAD